MTSTGSAPCAIGLRLIHDGTQPGPLLNDPLQFGLQDLKGEVHVGSAQSSGSLAFDVILGVTTNGAGQPLFRGAFAHGPPAKRFFYLSWKRPGLHQHPWGWRIKIPVSGLDWPIMERAARPGWRLEADVTGRRPHASEPVPWRVVRC